MSETYYSGYDSDRGRKPRRSLLLRLLDLLMTLLTAVTAVTMVVTFFVPYVDPGRTDAPTLPMPLASTGVPSAWASAGTRAKLS